MPMDMIFQGICVPMAEGDLTAALKSYSDSLAIREQLAKFDPGNCNRIR